MGRPDGRSLPGADAPVVHLVMPPWAGLGIHRTFGHRMPPMALLVLAALARREGWRVRYVDLNADTLPAEAPDLVGLSVWTMLAPQAYQLADRYRSRGVPVVLGGVHPSMLPGEALRHADAVVVGEAESVFARVLADAAAGRLGGVYQGSWGDMSAVPRVGEWTDILEGTPTFRYLPRNTVQTTRGCRFNCDFCSVIRINGRGSRHRDPEEIVEEIRVLDRRGQKFGPFFHVTFLDDDFASDLEFSAAMAEAIIRSGLRFSWAAQASIGLAGDPEMVALVARAGCTVLFTGFESISRETLVECNKKNRPHLYGECVRRLHDHRILVEGGFIFGFDADEAGVFDETVEFVDRIGVDAAHFSILTPLPGTHTFARMAGEGRITSYDWGEYDLYHAVFEPARMTRQQLQDGLWRAYRSFYSGSRRWRRWKRHVGMRLHPVVGTTISLTNANYAHRFKPHRTDRPRYVADPADLEALLVTSTAPAPQAISTAVAQFVAKPTAPAAAD
ncbi:MAG: B12-binding domain-containing radical SAM protein [Acidimicrobiales bacterium]